MAIIRIGNKDLQTGGGEMGVAGKEVVQAGYWCPIPCDHPRESIAAMVGQPTAPPEQFIAGVTVPEYGMPYCGTPIGLPGPPYIPLGVPAGLQKHVIANDTHIHIPGPTDKLVINVKEEPGLSYPEPVKHVHITESSWVPPAEFIQPKHIEHQVVPGAYGGNCGPGAAAGANCAPAAAPPAGYDAP